MDRPRGQCSRVNTWGDGNWVKGIPVMKPTTRRRPKRWFICSACQRKECYIMACGGQIVNCRDPHMCYCAQHNHQIDEVALP